MADNKAPDLNPAIFRLQFYFGFFSPFVNKLGEKRQHYWNSDVPNEGHYLLEVLKLRTLIHLLFFSLKFKVFYFLIMNILE